MRYLKMNENERENHSYIGDGVYAFFDGYGIRLRTGDHRDGRYDDEIYIEPDVLHSLNKFYERQMQGKLFNAKSNL